MTTGIQENAAVPKTPTGRDRNPSKLRSIFRTLLPLPIYRVVRGIVMALFTPSVYAAQHGYYRSAMRRSVVGSKGAAAPWMTFPLVSFLDTLSFTDRSILEFGSGQSTVWWGGRAKRVVALETDESWLERVRGDASPNVDVIGVPLEYDSQAEFEADVVRLLNGERFDVVIVDGGDRPKAMHTAPSVITDDGFIVVDDVDLFVDDPAWIGAMASLREAGFGRVDFYGLAVAAGFNRRRRCTSVFFRDGSFFTQKLPAATA